MTPLNFKCDRKCGECCIYARARVTKKDVERIRKAGHEDFYEWDAHIKSNVLKHNEQGCVFLRKKNGEYSCSIYPVRPKVCQMYPFVEKDEVEDCRPVVMGRFLEEALRRV